MTVKKHYIVPAIGIVEETIECFSQDVADGESNPGGTDFKPFFIRVKTDARPTTMGLTYEEYLFYPDTWTLAFHFKKKDNVYAEEPVTVEERTYLDRKGKLVKGDLKITSKETGKSMIPTIIDAKYNADLKEIKEASDRLVKGFDLIMNR